MREPVTCLDKECTWPVIVDVSDDGTMTIEHCMSAWYSHEEVEFLGDGNHEAGVLRIGQEVMNAPLVGGWKPLHEALLLRHETH